MHISDLSEWKQRRSTVVLISHTWRWFI